MRRFVARAPAKMTGKANVQLDTNAIPSVRVEL